MEEAVKQGAIQTYGQRLAGLSRNAKLYLVGALMRSSAFNLYGLFFNLYLLRLGFDAAFIGLVSTSRGMASLLCSLPAGLLADRIGRKRAMLIGFSGMVLARLCASVLPQRGAILVAYLFSGALSPLFTASIAPFLAENSRPEQRSTLFTFSSALTNLGGFVGSTGGGYLPALFAPLLNAGPESALAYRSVLLLSVGLLLLGTIPILLTTSALARAPIRMRAPIQMRAARPVGRRVSNPGLLLRLALPLLLFSFGASLFFPFLNVFFKQRFVVSDATLGWILGLTGLMAVPTTVIGGPVADRLGRIETMLYGRLVSTPLVLAIGLAPSLPVAVGAHWLRSGFMRVGDPLYRAFAMEQLPEQERATGASLMTMGGEVGGAIAPLISGLVQVRAGFTPLFWGTTIVYTVGLIAVWGFFMRPAKGTTA
jgi:MFS family permease